MHRRPRKHTGLKLAHGDGRIGLGVQVAPGLFLCGFLNGPGRVDVARRVGPVRLGRLAAKTEAAMVFGSHHDCRIFFFFFILRPFFWFIVATRANNAVDSSASIV